MGGFDEHVAIMGDWMPPSPSPRAFFSSILGDDFGTTRENKSGALISELEGYDLSRNSDGKGDQAASMSSRGGGLLERMAARAGFNAPRLNTESIRPADLSQNQEVRSPYLTIPPGLSPTTLLDSPVFLSNSLAQPSPTTGKFPFPSSGDVHISTMFMEASHQSKESSFDNNDSSSFAFKPVIQTAPSLFPSTFGKVPQFSLARQSFPSVQISVQSEPTQVYEQNGTLQQPDFSRSSTEMNNGSGNITSSIEHSPPPDEVQDEETDQRGCVDPNFLGAPADDGYNWRKYGQKQVKGSEYPRSYYKCTHTNCPVKKKVERSQEGHITEIIYKGAHNHPKPPPNRRSGLGPTNPLGDMQIENTEQGGNGGDGDPIWANMQKGDPDWRNNNLEVTTSAPLGSEYCNGAQNVTQFESRDAVDRSSTFSNDEDEDDRVTHGSASLGYDGEGDESESKRRKIETYAADMSGATRAIREPRVVVQTTSEVDILDDGYRWRKYGQKVVKGNPNPRSYYKCTSAGCTVRKHVERASHDLKSVITTYEGKHNHDVPAARNSSHINSGGGSNSGPTQGAPPPTQPHLHRPEPSQLQNAMARFDGPFSFGLAGRSQPGFGFGMNLQGLTNLAMAGKMPALPVHHPYIGQHRPSVNNMSFMGEPKMEPASDPGLNISNGSSVYQQVMSRLPLGPHM